MIGRRLVALAVGVGMAGAAGAHRVAPEEVVARLNAAGSRAITGVERAERDGQTPRLLVIRVGDRWYGRPASVREAEAGAWLALWRATVEQGIVAVLDARTDRPVVRFRHGEVAGLAAAPPER